MTAQSQLFGDLLKGAISNIAACEHKLAPIVEEELGEQIGVAGKTVQRYKAGHIPPEARSVRILAEAAVQRGFLNRVWLQRFLAAAHYPAPEKLIEQLCPPSSPRSRPPRIYENLPAPTYSQFVMRIEAYAEILDALQQRSAVVLIASLGGMGKTSLAREVAARCLQSDSDAPRFDAVVWVSDKDRPGTTNLSVVLDEIARTLDYPGFSQYEHTEKVHEVGQLLRRQRVLIADESLGQAIEHSLYKYILNFRQLYAICLYRKGQVDQAHILFHELLSEAHERGLRGSIVHNKLKLAAIELDRESFDEATELLAEVSAGARQYQYRWYIAETQRLYARLYTLRHDLPAARAALTEAIDVSERLGMRYFLSKARDELADLEAIE